MNQSKPSLPQPWRLKPLRTKKETTITTTAAPVPTTSTTTTTTTNCTTPQNLKKKQSCCYLAQETDWPWVWAIRDTSVLQAVGKQLDESTSTSSSSTPTSTSLPLHAKEEEEEEKQSKPQHNHKQQQQQLLQEEQPTTIILPVHIVNNLYLGNMNYTMEQLETLNIGKVLNMAGPFAVKNTKIKAMRRCGIQYKSIHAHDEEGYPLLKIHWQEAHNFIHSSSSQSQSSSSSSNYNRCIRRHLPRWLQCGSVHDGCSFINCCSTTTTNNNVFQNNDADADNNNNNNKQSKNNKKNDKKNILIHCVAGQNRSVLIIAVEYMLQTQQNVLQTMYHIRQRRGICALNNESFQEQLVSFARQSNLLGPIPGSHDCILSKTTTSSTTSGSSNSNPQQLKLQQQPPKPNWTTNFKQYI